MVVPSGSTWALGPPAGFAWPLGPLAASLLPREGVTSYSAQKILQKKKGKIREINAQCGETRDLLSEKYFFISHSVEI